MLRVTSELLTWRRVETQPQNNLETLETQLAKVTSERDEYAQLARLLREELERVKRGLMGPSRERFVADGQLSLAVLATALEASTQAAPPNEEPAVVVPSHKRKKPTGRCIPENLPQVDIETVPEDVQRAGLDAFVRIGEDVTQQVERRAGGLVRVRTVRGKYVPKDKPQDAPVQVLVAPPPELPIPGGMAGPGLLAETVVRRWQDHLPLHRMESIYAREGWEIPRSTMCEWHIKLAKLCEPLVSAMWKDALAQDVLLTDATGVLVQAQEKCKRAHFFVVVAPGRHALFRFTPKHTKQAVDGFLKGYGGYLVADAHTVYDHLYNGDTPDGATAVECGCWAHCRRYFFKALLAQPEMAKTGLALIKTLFELERGWQSLSAEKRQVQRTGHSTPAVTRFFAWVDEVRPTVLAETPMAAALNYANNQREALQRFLEDGRIPIHNNDSERALRRQAVGRKAWLFVGSDDGAFANATFVSLLASCQMHRVEPWGYLRDLFILLPSWPANRVLELSPLHWQQTISRQEVAAKLDANPHRRVTLGLPPTPG
jgi:transposase